MVKADWVKPGAVIIDVGINRIETTVDGESRYKLTGDVDFDDVAVLEQSDGTTGRRFGTDVTDTRACRPAGKPAAPSWEIGSG